MGKGNGEAEKGSAAPKTIGDGKESHNSGTTCGGEIVRVTLSFAEGTKTPESEVESVNDGSSGDYVDRPEVATIHPET